MGPVTGENCLAILVLPYGILCVHEFFYAVGVYRCSVCSASGILHPVRLSVSVAYKSADAVFVVREKHCIIADKHGIITDKHD